MRLTACDAYRGGYRGDVTAGTKPAGADVGNLRELDLMQCS